MKYFGWMLWLLVGCLWLSACEYLSASREPKSLVKQPFHMIYYDIRQPEKTFDGGEHDMALNFINSFRNQIDGEFVGVRWQGKIELDKDETIAIQHSDASKLKLTIDGKPIPLLGSGYHRLALNKGSHDVALVYEPKWFANEMAVRFWRTEQSPQSIEYVAKKIVAKERDILLYAPIQPDFDVDTQQYQTPSLAIPAANEAQILVLSSPKLRDVVLRPHKDADIKAIVALQGVGKISGSDAPVFRLTQAVDDTLWAQGCDCVGGVTLHCSGSMDKGYVEIQQLSKTLFQRGFDRFYQDKIWADKSLVQQGFEQAQKLYQDTQARCGGDKKLTFNNAFSGSLNVSDSWWSKIGGSVPETGFRAYYFKQDAMDTPVAEENVSHIGIHYIHQDFHGIDAKNFAALWVGNIHAKEDMVMSMQYDLSWAQVRVWLDGQSVYEYQHADNRQSREGSFDLILTKGSHRLEVAFINHWHTVGFALYPQRKILIDQSDEVRALLNQPDYAVAHAKVYESNARYGTIDLHLPPSNKPVVLVLESHHSVFWRLQPSQTPLKAVIIQNGKGVVSGSRAPTYRLPKILRVNRKMDFKFDKYETDRIEQFTAQ